MNSQFELSIVITSYKQPDILRLCLQSIKKTIKNIEYEIVVADSATSEETIDLMREEFGKIKFFPSKHNIGFVATANCGMKAAKGEYILVINSDIVFKEGSIEKLLTFVKENPDVGLVGPKLINFDGSVQQSCFRFYTPLTIIYRRTFLRVFSFAKKHLQNFEMKKEQAQGVSIEADWVMGSVTMVSREVVRDVGMMDPRFFMYMEDVDWCWRIWQSGRKVIYYPELKVYHYHGKQSRNRNFFGVPVFNKYVLFHIQSAMKFFWKHLGQKDPHKNFRPRKDIQTRNN